jgi:tetratricopeptide (TPR) repeat protein
LKQELAPRSIALLLVIAAAGVLAPLFTWLPGAFDDVRLDAGVLAIVGCAAILVPLLVLRRVPAPTPGTFLIYGALALGLLPLLFVPWRSSMAGLADRAPLLSAWALAGLTASGWIETERLLRWILVGCAVASAYALLSWTGVDPLGWKPWPEAPPVAPYTGINHAAELLTPLLVAAAILLPEVRKRPILWIAVAICAFHAGTLGVLAGRISLVAGLALIGWRRPPARAGAGLIAGLFLAGEITRSLLAAPAALPPSPEAALPPSLQIRQELYLAAGQQIPHRPIGLGLGRFETDYPLWRSEEEARLSTNDWKSRIYRSPKTLHSDPLQLLLECGWLGGAMLLAALLLLARPAPLWFQAPLLAFAVHALVRAPLLDNPPALAFFALLCGAAGRASANLLRMAQPRRTRAAAWLVAAGALAAVIPARGQIVGEHQIAAALDPDGPNAAAALRKATETRPWDARGWELRGLGYLAVQEWAYSRYCFEQALEHNPTSLGALTGLVQVEMSAPSGDRKLGLDLLARAEMLAGKHPLVREARAHWLEAVAALHRAEGDARLASGGIGAGSLLLSAELATARMELLRGEEAKSRAALQRGARYAASYRALVERTARNENLNDALLQELTLRIFPGWPDDLESRPQE